MTKNTADKVVVENVNVPGHTSRVDADKYNNVKKALLKVLPKKSPGMSFNEIKAALPDTLDESLFPGGEKVGWWCKTVQLDLEAKGILVREDTKPLRWYRQKQSA